MLSCYYVYVVLLVISRMHVLRVDAPVPAAGAPTSVAPVRAGGVLTSADRPDILPRRTLAPQRLPVVRQCAHESTAPRYLFAMRRGAHPGP